MKNEKFHYRINKFKNLTKKFYESITTFYYILFQNKDLKDIILKNRRFLSNCGPFLKSQEFELNDYGMDKSIFINLDKPLNQFPTYTDLILYSQKFLSNKKINYLEIGASVMKNFMQIDNYLVDSNLIAYDINPVVPKYENDFKLSESSNRSNSKIYHNKTKNNLSYFMGSVLDQKDTSNFNDFINFKFNLIFSDALHTPEGVWSEYKNIISENLDNEFILFFDDLDFEGLSSTAKQIFDDLSQNNKELYFTSFKANGWVGQHEKRHKNGIISNINFYKIFNENNINLPQMKLEIYKS